MKLLATTAGWKIFLFVLIISVAPFFASFQASDNPAVVFIPAVISGCFFYSWMYGVADCFGERDPIFAGARVKVASILALLGFLCIWIQAYQIANQIPNHELPQEYALVMSLLALAFHPSSLYASYALTKARFRLEGREAQKIGILRIAPRAIILTVFPILAWPLFHSKFRKLCVE